MVQPFDIVGYSYRAANLCAPCTAYKVCRGATVTDPPSASEARAMIEVEAVDRDINFDDESTFDSSEFPKVIFRDQAEHGETCDVCQEPLDIC
jgi:hypothetical protein